MNKQKNSLKKSRKKRKESREKLLYKDTMFAADSATAAIKNSIHSNFIIPFALAIGTPASFIPMIASAPELIGGFFQLFSAKLMKLIKNRKLLIVLTSALDAILWIPIMLVPFFFNNNYYILLGLIILQSIALSILRPIYNSVLSDFIPKKRRGQVLGKINKISSAVSLVSTLVFGFLLKSLTDLSPYFGFGIIFIFAFISRSVSTVIRSSYNDKGNFVEEKKYSILKFTRNLRKNRFGNFVLFSSLFRFGVGIAAPFFTVYMLESLKMDYFTYTVLNVASIVSSYFILDKWGRDLDKRGTKKLLEICSYVIPIIPILWAVFKSPIWLFVVQLISGAAWSGFSLASSNFIIEISNRRNRLQFNSYFHFFTGMFTFIGAILGGFLVHTFAQADMAKTYVIIFAISGIFRLIVSGYFIPIINEEKTKDHIWDGPMSKRVIGLHTQEGLDFMYIPRKKEKE